MKRLLLLGLAACGLPLMLASCVETEPKPVGPASENSMIPWNRPVPGQGQGQMNMMQQNQYRR